MGQNAYQTAVETLARRRSHAEAQAARRREELYQSLPELRRFDARAAALCRQMTAAILEGAVGRIPAGPAGPAGGAAGCSAGSRRR